MLTVYFDESYSHSPAPLVYTVGGYLATDRRWRKFEKEWKAVLDSESLPPFSMKDFDNPHSKTYGTWPKEKKITFLKTLHGIINKTYLMSFSTSVIVSDYQALSDVEKFVFGRPHPCAAVNCLKHIAEWATEAGVIEPILYVFEEGTVDDKELRRLFNQTVTAEQKAHYRIRSLAFGTKELSPLQAADIVAYETRKEISRRLDSEHHRDVRASIKHLNDAKRDVWAIMDKRHFNLILSRSDVQEQLNEPGFLRDVEIAKKRGLL